MTTISVIVPVLNEAANLPKVLATIQTHTNQAIVGIEVIVVDGGSQDNTVDIAQQTGAKVLCTHPGRAHQMNAGAEIATGEILVFVHGDTQLPPNYATLVQTALTQPKVVAGAFDLAIQGNHWGLRWVEWGVKWRSRFCQLPYGDQALFVPATRFHQLGGFPELPIMEDFVFVQRLRRLGKIAIAPACVITSGRRWQKLGIFKTTVLNQIIVLGYFAGIAPQRLAKWYRRLR